MFMARKFINEQLELGQLVPFTDCKWSRYGFFNMLVFKLDVHSKLGAISNDFWSQVEWRILILHKNVTQLERA